MKSITSRVAANNILHTRSMVQCRIKLCSISISISTTRITEQQSDHMAKPLSKKEVTNPKSENLPNLRNTSFHYLLVVVIHVH